MLEYLKSVLSSTDYTRNTWNKLLYNLYNTIPGNVCFVNPLPKDLIVPTIRWYHQLTGHVLGHLADLKEARKVLGAC
jgi:hypothetical protein